MKALLIFLLLSSPGEKRLPSYSLAFWPEHPSFMAFREAGEAGLLDGKKGGLGSLEEEWEVDIELIEAEYAECIRMYTDGEADAVCVSTLDILRPCLTRESVAVLPLSAVLLESNFFPPTLANLLVVSKAAASHEEGGRFARLLVKAYYEVVKGREEKPARPAADYMALGPEARELIRKLLKEEEEREFSSPVVRFFLTPEAAGVYLVSKEMQKDVWETIAFAVSHGLIPILLKSVSFDGEPIVALRFTSEYTRSLEPPERPVEAEGIGSSGLGIVMLVVLILTFLAALYWRGKRPKA